MILVALFLLDIHLAFLYLSEITIKGNVWVACLLFISIQFMGKISN